MEDKLFLEAGFRQTLIWCYPAEVTHPKYPFWVTHSKYPFWVTHSKCPFWVTHPKCRTSSFSSSCAHESVGMTSIGDPATRPLFRMVLCWRGRDMIQSMWLWLRQSTWVQTYSYAVRGWVSQIWWYTDRVKFNIIHTWFMEEAIIENQEHSRVFMWIFKRHSCPKSGIYYK